MLFMVSNASETRMPELSPADFLKKDGSVQTACLT